MFRGRRNERNYSKMSSTTWRNVNCRRTLLQSHSNFSGQHLDTSTFPAFEIATAPTTFWIAALSPGVVGFAEGRREVGLGENWEIELSPLLCADDTGTAFGIWLGSRGLSIFTMVLGFGLASFNLACSSNNLRVWSSSNFMRLPMIWTLFFVIGSGQWGLSKA